MTAVETFMLWYCNLTIISINGTDILAKTCEASKKYQIRSTYITTTTYKIVVVPYDFAHKYHTSIIIQGAAKPLLNFKKMN